MMENNMQPLVGDMNLYDKKYPLKALASEMMKKPKWMEEVYFQFTRSGKVIKGWVTAVQGGAMSSKIDNPSEFGSQIKIFFPPQRGEKLFKGEHQFWLEDIGIGKTEKECRENFMKFKWFKQQKSELQNKRFWVHWNSLTYSERLAWRNEWNNCKN